MCALAVHGCVRACVYPSRVWVCACELPVHVCMCVCVCATTSKEAKHQQSLLLLLLLLSSHSLTYVAGLRAHKDNDTFWVVRVRKAPMSASSCVRS